MPASASTTPEEQHALSAEARDLDARVPRGSRAIRRRDRSRRRPSRDLEELRQRARSKTASSAARLPGRVVPGRVDARAGTTFVIVDDSTRAASTGAIFQPVGHGDEDLDQGEAPCSRSGSGSPCARPCGPCVLLRVVADGGSLDVDRRLERRQQLAHRASGTASFVGVRPRGRWSRPHADQASSAPSGRRSCRRWRC